MYDSNVPLPLYDRHQVGARSRLKILFFLNWDCRCLHDSTACIYFFCHVFSQCPNLPRCTTVRRTKHKRQLLSRSGIHHGIVRHTPGMSQSDSQKPPTRPIKPLVRFFRRARSVNLIDEGINFFDLRRSPQHFHSGMGADNRRRIGCCHHQDHFRGSGKTAPQTMRMVAAVNYNHLSRRVRGFQFLQQSFFSQGRTLRPIVRHRRRSQNPQIGRHDVFFAWTEQSNIAAGRSRFGQYGVDLALCQSNGQINGQGCGAHAALAAYDQNHARPRQRIHIIRAVAIPHKFSQFIGLIEHCQFFTIYPGCGELFSLSARRVSRTD